MNAHQNTQWLNEIKSVENQRNNALAYIENEQQAVKEDCIISLMNQYQIEQKEEENELIEKKLAILTQERLTLLFHTMQEQLVAKFPDYQQSIEDFLKNFAKLFTEKQNDLNSLLVHFRQLTKMLGISEEEADRFTENVRKEARQEAEKFLKPTPSTTIQNSQASVNTIGEDQVTEAIVSTVITDGVENTEINTTSEVLPQAIPVAQPVLLQEKEKLIALPEPVVAKTETEVLANYFEFKPDRLKNIPQEALTLIVYLAEQIRLEEFKRAVSESPFRKMLKTGYPKTVFNENSKTSKDFDLRPMI